MLNALQTLPAATEAGAKPSREAKGRDQAVDDKGFAKLMQQQSQLRQSGQRQLEQRQLDQCQAESRLLASQAAAAKASQHSSERAETSDAGRAEPDRDQDGAAAQDANPPPWWQAQRADASRQPAVQGGQAGLAGNDDPMNGAAGALPRTGRPGAASPAQAESAESSRQAGLTASAAASTDSAAAADGKLPISGAAPLSAAAKLAQLLPKQAPSIDIGGADEPPNAAADQAGDDDGPSLGGLSDAADAPTAGRRQLAAGHRHDAAVALSTGRERATARDGGREDPLPAPQAVAGEALRLGLDSVIAGGLGSAPMDNAMDSAMGSAMGSAMAASAVALAAPPQAIDAPAAPTQAQLHVPLDSPLFAPALGSQISLLARDGVMSAQLQLNPAEMGPISVQIMLDGQAARVDFQADLAHTRSVIEASLPALASALQDAGLTLAGGGVFQQSAGHQHSGNGQPRAHSRGAEARQAGEAPALATAAWRAASGRGLVDLVA